MLFDMRRSVVANATVPRVRFRWRAMVMFCVVVGSPELPGGGGSLGMACDDVAIPLWYQTPTAR
jgi:hypothetical protein